MEFTKESLTQSIKEASNLEELAAQFGISRRSLLRLRERYGVVHIPCMGAYARPRKPKTTEVTFTVPSNIEEYTVSDLTDINNVLDSLIKHEEPEYSVGLFDVSNFSSEEEKLQEKNDLKTLCDKLGISVKELKKLQSKDVEERVNLNLNKEYEGRFKEKSDITHKNYQKFVITSIQNDTEINKEFYNSLLNYCEANKAKLLVVPVYYNFGKMSSFALNESEMFFDNIQLTDSLKLYASLKVLPTIVDPFAGVESLSKGDSIIIPHPQVSMKTMPTLGSKPAQMYTTGSISIAEGAYARTKTGYKAEFNHSIAALVVEIGKGSSFHIRQLNCDDNGGFYDIDGYYLNNAFEKLTHVEAIYLGDTHVGVIDPLVVNATFKAKDSMVNLLKPKVLIHGDILDFSSRSHHDDKDYLVSAAKALTGLNNVEDELKGVGTFLRSSKIEGMRNIIISSNHNEHLYKWLTTSNTKDDLINAKLYHKLCYLMLERLERIPSGVSYPNLLELYFENSDFKDVLNYTEFSNRREGYKIKDIEISMHGDKGPNGSRGSPNAFSRLPTKSIVGHSHSPSIRLGCYTVGTSSMLDLSYNAGASSWMQTHCIIYPNGKRQMINIINGTWNYK